MAKMRVLVEETYQHIQEYDVPDDKIDDFDYQDAVREAYEEARAVPGKGKLAFLQVNIGDTGDAEWKELWPKSDGKLPVVKVPKKKPVYETVLRVLVKTDGERLVSDVVNELKTRLLSADGGHHLETMNWGPDEEMTMTVLDPQ